METLKMKTLKMYEDSERLVKLIQWTDNTFTASIVTKDGKYTGSQYKLLFWAERKFIEFRDYPLKTIRELK